MKPEAQRIAIAEACGAKWIPDQWGNQMLVSSDGDSVLLIDVHGGMPFGLPDYLNDLNAMHEAENWYFSQCKTVDERSLWLDNLAVVCGWKEAASLTEAKFISDLNCSRATAAQRAEAFLRTIGKWTDETNTPAGSGDPAYNTGCRADSLTNIC